VWIRTKLESRLGDPDTALRTYVWTAVGGFALAAIVLSEGVIHALGAPTGGQMFVGIVLAITSFVPAAFGVSGVLGVRDERASHLATRESKRS
jgi:hypothetical protein